MVRRPASYLRRPTTGAATAWIRPRLLHTSPLSPPPSTIFPPSPSASSTSGGPISTRSCRCRRRWPPPTTTARIPGSLHRSLTLADVHRDRPPDLAVRLSSKGRFAGFRRAVRCTSPPLVTHPPPSQWSSATTVAVSMRRDAEASAARAWRSPLLPRGAPCPAPPLPTFSQCGPPHRAATSPPDPSDLSCSGPAATAMSAAPWERIWPPVQQIWPAPGKSLLPTLQQHVALPRPPLTVEMEQAERRGHGHMASFTSSHPLATYNRARGVAMHFSAAQRPWKCSSKARVMRFSAPQTPLTSSPTSVWACGLPARCSVLHWFW